MSDLQESRTPVTTFLESYARKHGISLVALVGYYFDDPSYADKPFIPDTSQKRVYPTAIHRQAASYLQRMSQYYQYEFVKDRFPDADLAVGLSSVCLVRNQLMHIPMLDLNVNHAEVPLCINFRDWLIAQLQETNESATIVWSGASYHLYGPNLMTSHEYYNWMSRLAEHPIIGSVVEANFVDLSIEREHGCLRLLRSFNGEKPIDPYVVTVV